MLKYKMEKDWKFAADGIEVIEYKKGCEYEVNERCAEICEKHKFGKRLGSVDTEPKEAKPKEAKPKEADKGKK